MPGTRVWSTGQRISDEQRERYNGRERQRRLDQGEEINRAARERREQDGEQIRQVERARYAANPEIKKRSTQRSKHGPDHAEVRAAMWAAQDGRCYLCGGDLSASSKVVFDHSYRCCPRGRSCHICRRGLACNNCNLAIGLLGDDPARLRRMADALEQAQREVDDRRRHAGFEQAGRPESRH